MPKILLIGNTGQLGWELERALAPLGEVHAVDFPEIDLARGESVRRTIGNCGRLHMIVNAAAYTAVDRAESEPDKAMAVNADGPGVLAEEAYKLGALFIHYSTDYVFDGAKGKPYVETDAPNPLGIYGASKLAGERAVEQVGGAYLILRTAWVYSLRGDSFVTKVLRWAKEQRQLKIVEDQVSNPTWAKVLAEATARILSKAEESPAKGGLALRIKKGDTADLSDVNQWIAERAGIYHLAGDGWASRLEWASEILRLDPRAAGHLTRELLPAKTADFSTPAKRPLFSALDCGRFESTFGFRLPPWKDSLRRALDLPSLNVPPLE
jgi:dTDP-4-dehydrorhamnose reductase